MIAERVKLLKAETGCIPLPVIRDAGQFQDKLIDNLDVDSCIAAAKQTRPLKHVHGITLGQALTRLNISYIRVHVDKGQQRPNTRRPKGRGYAPATEAAGATAAEVAAAKNGSLRN